MIVIYWSTLIFSIQVFKDDTSQPISLLKFQFAAKHHILKSIQEYRRTLPFPPVAIFTITICTQEIELGMVLKIMIQIKCHRPIIIVEIHTSQPTAQLIT